MGSKIDYFPMGPWPVCVAFTRDQKAFKAEVARLGFPDGPDLIPGNGGNAGTHRVPVSPLTFIITMQPDTRQLLPRQVAALIAHEATHVARWFFKSIGEKKPSAEAQAYFVQYIVQGCLELIDKENRRAAKKSVSDRKPKKRKNSKAGCEFEEGVS